MGMSMIEAAQAEWDRWHGDMDKEDIPRMNPSFWKGFKGGAAWAGYAGSGMKSTTGISTRLKYENHRTKF